MSGIGFEIIILLVVAVVLLIRLIGTLGSRDGYEPPMRSAEKSPQKPTLELVDDEEDFDVEQYADGNALIAGALEKAKAIEPNFNVGDFLNGSKRAYEMILMAFLNGDVDEVKPFVDANVHKGFVTAIKARDKRGETIEANFSGIRDVTLKSAEFDEKTNELALGVEYVAELSQIVKDKAGKVIAGDKSKVETEIDYWQFARKMGSADPNWQLVATGE